jgi:hypothetical protein
VRSPEGGCGVGEWGRRGAGPGAADARASAVTAAGVDPRPVRAGAWGARKHARASGHRRLQRASREWEAHAKRARPRPLAAAAAWTADWEVPGEGSWIARSVAIASIRIRGSTPLSIVTNLGSEMGRGLGPSAVWPECRVAQVQRCVAKYACAMHGALCTYQWRERNIAPECRGRRGALPCLRARAQGPGARAPLLLVLRRLRGPCVGPPHSHKKAPSPGSQTQPPGVGVAQRYWRARR